MAGFTLIELLIVLTLMGLTFTMALPRLSAALAGPKERDLRNIEQFVLRAGRRALRSPLVPLDQLDAKPLRIKIAPPRDLVLLQADTEIARLALAEYRIEEVKQQGLETPPEPEFAFNTLGLTEPFTLHLSGPSVEDRMRWRIDRLGTVRTESGE